MSWSSEGLSPFCSALQASTLLVVSSSPWLPRPAVSSTLSIPEPSPLDLAWSVKTAVGYCSSQIPWSGMFLCVLSDWLAAGSPTWYWSRCPDCWAWFANLLFMSRHNHLVSDFQWQIPEMWELTLTGSIALAVISPSPRYSSANPSPNKRIEMDEDSLVTAVTNIHFLTWTDYESYRILILIGELCPRIASP